MLRSVMFFCLFGFAMTGWTATDTPINRLRTFLTSASTLEAQFEQASIDEQGEKGMRAYGAFYLQRPGKFRWDYRQPYRQEIVSQGSKVWFYDADLEQVTVKKLDLAIGSTPALLLSGDVDLEQNFIIEAQGKEESDGLAWIKLRPKSEESTFKYVLLGLQGNVLNGMELADNFGQLTRIYFSQVKAGGKIDQSLFQFTPPPGVDIFEDGQH